MRKQGRPRGSQPPQVTEEERSARWKLGRANRKWVSAHRKSETGSEGAKSEGVSVSRETFFWRGFCYQKITPPITGVLSRKESSPSSYFTVRWGNETQARWVANKTSTWLKPNGRCESRNLKPKLSDVDSLQAQCFLHVECCWLMRIQQRSAPEETGRFCLHSVQSVCPPFSCAMSSYVSLRRLCWSPVLPVHSKTPHAFTWIFNSRMLKWDVPQNSAVMQIM